MKDVRPGTSTRLISPSLLGSFCIYSRQTHGMNHAPEQELDNDDEMQGTLLTRRRALGLLGLGSLSAVCSTGLLLSGRSEATSAMTNLPRCMVTPAKTVGPYFKEEHLIRSDLRSDTKSGQVCAGIPLTLTFRVLKVGVGGCTPLSGITLDVWQADAQGIYSNIGGEHTLGQNYLRGAQVTDARGLATFSTIYPGWYPSRAVHIHFKARQIVDGQVKSSFTSQLFFDDLVTDEVVKQPAYLRPSARKVRNANDSIYGNGGHQLQLTLKGTPQTGFTSAFDLGINLK